MCASGRVEPAHDVSGDRESQSFGWLVLIPGWIGRGHASPLHCAYGTEDFARIAIVLHDAALFPASP